MWGWPSAEAATPIIAFLGWLCTYRLGTFIKCYVHIINATVVCSGPQIVIAPRTSMSSLGAASSKSPPLHPLVHCEPGLRSRALLVCDSADIV